MVYHILTILNQYYPGFYSKRSGAAPGITWVTGFRAADREVTVRSPEGWAASRFQGDEDRAVTVSSVCVC